MSEPAGTGHTLRLHPLSWLFMTAASSKGLIFPWLLLMFASRGSNIELFSILFVIPALVSALLRYAVFRYRLGEDEIEIRDGVLTRNERHIPYARIQNVDLVRNPFHRLAGVALVRLETAGGQSPEAVIRVLSLAAVEQLRRRVQAHREAAPEEESGARTLLELSDADLVQLGLISNRGALVLAAIAGIFWQTGGLESRLQNVAPELLQRTFEGFGSWSLWWIVPALVLLLLLLRLFSVAWYLFTLRGFRLQLEGDQLRADYGLLNRVSATIPVHRIQLITSHASFLHRLLDRVSVRLETAGSVGGEGQGSGFDSRSESLWLAPLLPAAKLPGLLREAVPEIELEGLEWQPLAAGARGRLARRGCALSLLVAAGLFPLLGPASLAVGGAGVALALVHSRLYPRHAAWALPGWGVVFRSGWWVRRASYLRFSKCQSVLQVRSPFDRRHRMASLRVDTAGAGRLEHRVAIPFLPDETARGLADHVYHEAGRRDFRW